jgi:hypothetical protein
LVLQQQQDSLFVRHVLLHCVLHRAEEAEDQYNVECWDGSSDGNSGGSEIKSLMLPLVPLLLLLWMAAAVVADATRRLQGRNSPIFLQFFYLFSIFFLNCF